MLTLSIFNEKYCEKGKTVQQSDKFTDKSV